jgi:hypothetical protein
MSLRLILCLVFRFFTVLMYEFRKFPLILFFSSHKILLSLLQESIIKQRNPLWQSRRILRIPLGCSRVEFEQRTRLRAQAILDERTLVDATARQVAEVLGIINVSAVVPYVRRANGDPDLAVQLYRHSLPTTSAVPPPPPPVPAPHDDDDDDDDADIDDKRDDRPISVRKLSARAIDHALFEL